MKRKSYDWMLGLECMGQSECVMQHQQCTTPHLEKFRAKPAENRKPRESLVNDAPPATEAPHPLTHHAASRRLPAPSGARIRDGVT